MEQRRAVQATRFFPDSHYAHILSHVLDVASFAIISRVSHKWQLIARSSSAWADTQVDLSDVIVPTSFYPVAAVAWARISNMIVTYANQNILRTVFCVVYYRSSWGDWNDAEQSFTSTIGYWHRHEVTLLAGFVWMMMSHWPARRDVTLHARQNVSHRVPALLVGWTTALTPAQVTNALFGTRVEKESQSVFVVLPSRCCPTGCMSCSQRLGSFRLVCSSPTGRIVQRSHITFPTPCALSANFDISLHLRSSPTGISLDIRDHSTALLCSASYNFGGSFFEWGYRGDSYGHFFISTHASRAPHINFSICDTLDTIPALRIHGDRRESIVVD